MNFSGDSGDSGVISYGGEVRRKLVHLSSLWMPLVMVAAGEDRRRVMCAGFALLFVVSMAVERMYVLNVPVIAPLYGLVFGGMLRRRPSPRQWLVSGGPHVLAASAFSLLLFPVSVAAAAMAVMLLGDTAAALVGRRFGRHRINGKSWEGTAAFVVFGYAGAALFLALSGGGFLHYLTALPAVMFAAAVELFAAQLRVNDNFSIPAAFGAVMVLSTVFFG
ncbi:MAG: hypothetical protein PHI85_04360 [Victivallaceae bacterium]|nr:hypothetical protein [Victivallaceae bacterium]